MLQGKPLKPHNHWLHSVTKPFRRFMEMEISSGIVLLASAVLALIFANSPLKEFYSHLTHLPISVGVGNWSITESLHFWVNDVLMVIFFYVVGMEIKRELAIGTLNSPKKAALPAFAAIGGMAIPAGIYYFLNPTGELSNGWGIPMATDIAFSIGLLSLLGKKIPISAKVFLLALAIVDDLGAVLAIAFFYSEEILPKFLGLAVVVAFLIYILQSAGVRKKFVYFCLGAALWLSFYNSGIHTTVAGVVLGFLIPVHPLPEEEASPLEESEKTFLPWVSFGIMPLFAFVNGGISFESLSFEVFASSTLTWGIILGLVVGKPLGVCLASFAAVWLKAAEQPKALKSWHILGAGLFAGVGFTMSLFISHLAISPVFEDTAKLAIFIASLISGLLGLSVLWAYNFFSNAFKQ